MEIETNTHENEGSKVKKVAPKKWSAKGAELRDSFICCSAFSAAGAEAAPCDAPDDARFTVVLNTFERRAALQKAVAHYAMCASVAEIVGVWSEQAPAPDPADANARLYFPQARSRGAPPARYESHDTTSIQNRFEVTGVRTSAVFHVDDDVRMPCGARAGTQRQRRRGRGAQPRGREGSQSDAHGSIGTAHTFQGGLQARENLSARCSAP